LENQKNIDVVEKYCVKNVEAITIVKDTTKVKKI